jgi:hypothetical protein
MDGKDEAIFEGRFKIYEIKIRVEHEFSVHVY